MRIFRICIAILVISSQQSSLTAHDKVTVHLTGSIEPECVMSTPVDTINLSSLWKAGALRLDIMVYCNAPFDVVVTSKHGALLHELPSAGLTRFAAQINYELYLVLPTTAGEMRLTCNSRELKEAGNCSSAQSLSGISTGAPGYLDIQWGVPEAVVQAGRYSDELTLVVQTRL